MQFLPKKRLQVAVRMSYVRNLFCDLQLYYTLYIIASCDKAFKYKKLRVLPLCRLRGGLTFLFDKWPLLETLDFVLRTSAVHQPFILRLVYRLHTTFIALTDRKGGWLLKFYKNQKLLLMYQLGSSHHRDEEQTNCWETVFHFLFSPNRLSLYLQQRSLLQLQVKYTETFMPILSYVYTLRLIGPISYPDGCDLMVQP